MIKILIVEDEKPISDLIKLSLTKAGYSCKCAYDGEEAADMLDSNVFDLVLLDVMLPKADGFEVMEYIAPLGIFGLTPGLEKTYDVYMTLGTVDEIRARFKTVHDGRQ